MCKFKKRRLYEARDAVEQTIENCRYCGDTEGVIQNSQELQKIENELSTID